MVQTIKVLVVGPQQSGKSTIANALASALGDGGPESMDVLSGRPYQPTAAVRVVEFEVGLSSGQSRRWNGERQVAVELWDCSGDSKYESCWPAIQKEVDGVILVYNPENPAHSSEAYTWYEWFVEKGGLSPEQCLVLANDRKSGNEDPRGKPPSAFDECEFCYTDEADTSKIMAAFQDLVGSIGKFKSIEA